jgi:hypothetical protein
LNSLRAVQHKRRRNTYIMLSAPPACHALKLFRGPTPRIRRIYFVAEFSCLFGRTAAQASAAEPVYFVVIEQESHRVVARDRAVLTARSLWESRLIPVWPPLA